MRHAGIAKRFRGLYHRALGLIGQDGRVFFEVDHQILHHLWPRNVAFGRGAYADTAIGCGRIDEELEQVLGLIGGFAGGGPG